MNYTFINSDDDIDWLQQTHLRAFKFPWHPESAVIYGNEDFPTMIELYRDKEPNFDDDSIVLKWSDETEQYEVEE
jgi:hypothetical protein